MWPESINYGKTPEMDTNKDIKREYHRNSDKLNVIKMREKKERDKYETQAERLITDVKFNINEWEELDQWKLEFNLTDIKWYIDIDNDLLVVNWNEYKIHLPKWADLVWIKLEKDNLIIKGQVAFFSGVGSVSLDLFKEEIIKLSDWVDTQLVETDSWKLEIEKIW